MIKYFTIRFIGFGKLVWAKNSFNRIRLSKHMLFRALNFIFQTNIIKKSQAYLVIKLRSFYSGSLKWDLLNYVHILFNRIWHIWYNSFSTLMKILTWLSLFTFLSKIARKTWFITSLIFIKGRSLTLILP
jgi:hypothetical protein